MSHSVLIPLSSWLLDRVLGDPPNRWHPVAWQGRFLAWAEGRIQGPGGRGQGSGVRDQESVELPERSPAVVRGTQSKHVLSAVEGDAALSAPPLPLGSDFARFVWGAGVVLAGIGLSAGAA